jgi:cephalosporin-C deacetylase-like acetyl esterase
MAFSLGFLGLSLLGAAWTFPHRYAPASTDFDTGFMGALASADGTPLATAWGASTDETFEGTPITVQDLTFLSERWNGVDVSIAAALARPRSVAGRIPALVVVHGYGGTHESMMGVARELAASGRVAIAIDAPDSGGSTPYPRRTPGDLVNVTSDPRGGFLYHVAYAASRALSVAESLPYVDPGRLGVIGASQGGLTSLYLAAKDPRVAAALPMIPGGNLEEAYWAPSLAHLLLPKDATLSDPRLVGFRRHFDPLGYAPLITAPVLFMAGTADEFFPIWGVMSTYDAIPSRKWLSLVPNHGHSGYEGWIPTAMRFLDWAFDGAAPLPDPAVLGVASDLLGVHVTASATAASEVVLLWRGSTAGEPWRATTMSRAGGLHTATVGPVWPGRVSLFVSIVEAGVYTTATPAIAVDATGYPGPALLIATAGMTAYLWGLLGLPFRERRIPILAVVLAVGGSAWAWIGVPGRTAWGVYEIADRSPLGGFLLGAYLVFFSALFATALLRPRKLLVLSWVPVIFSATVYGIAAALLGGAATLAPSWGFALIVAAPLLVLADRRWRKETRVF